MLTDEQEIAAKPYMGFDLIVAGAGSGKTRVLAERIDRTSTELTEISPKNIVMTFSKKAAAEIVHRIHNKYSIIISGTFHSVALSIIKNQYSGKWRIISEGEEAEIINKIFAGIKDSFYGIPNDVILEIIRMKKIKRNQYVDKLPAGLRVSIENIEKLYEEKKKINNWLSYSDLIKKATVILRELNNNDVIHGIYGSDLFVDEFQDCSQDLIDFIIALKPRSLCAVGDDFQGIYGFRGGNIEFIVNFKKYFPESRILYLSRNFRSRSEIIDLAGSAISHNKKRLYKKIISVRGFGGKVIGIPVLTKDEEINAINRILINIDNNKPVAILSRNNDKIEFIKNNLHCELSNIEYLTIHSSKGLEFDTVILAGVEDKIFPGANSCIEEERRLLYVAITRAKDSFYMLYYCDKDKPALFAKETILSYRYKFTEVLKGIRQKTKAPLRMPLLNNTFSK